MTVRLFVKSAGVKDFSTLCEVPVAGDSYWSSQRSYDAVTGFQIPQPIGNQRGLFF